MDNDRRKELFLELAGLVYELNGTSANDWFFSFSGHVDSVSVHYTESVNPTYCKCCGEGKKENVFLSHLTSLETLSPIKELIKRCREILDKEENETNPPLPKMQEVSPGQ